MFICESLIRVYVTTICEFDELVVNVGEGDIGVCVCGSRLNNLFAKQNLDKSLSSFNAQTLTRCLLLFNVECKTT